MFTSSGILQFDPLKGTKRYEPGWCLVSCSNEIARYYAWHLKRHGMEVNPQSPWGTHISVIRGEPLPDPSCWGKFEGLEVEFHYSHLLRHDNGQHAWLEVYSDDLAEVRKSFGFPHKPWFHLTVGRLERPYA